MKFPRSDFSHPRMFKENLQDTELFHLFYEATDVLQKITGCVKKVVLRF